MATTSLSSEGPSAEGLGPKLPDRAVRRPADLGAWPSEGDMHRHDNKAPYSGGSEASLR